MTVETINIRYLFIISTFIQIFLFGYIWASIYKLESTGCKCNPDWRRTYILVFSAFAVFIALVELFMVKIQWGVRSAINLVYIVALVVFTYCAISYSHQLKTEKCKCSSELTNQVLYLVGIINAAVLSLAAVISLIAIIGVYVATPK